METQRQGVRLQHAEGAGCRNGIYGDIVAVEHDAVSAGLLRTVVLHGHVGLERLATRHALRSSEFDGGEVVLLLVEDVDVVDADVGLLGITVADGAELDEDELLVGPGGEAQFLALPSIGGHRREVIGVELVLLGVGCLDEDAQAGALTLLGVEAEEEFRILRAVECDLRHIH